MQAILWTFIACLTGDHQAVAEQMPWIWSDKRASLPSCIGMLDGFAIGWGPTDDKLRPLHIRLCQPDKDTGLPLIGTPPILDFQANRGTVLVRRAKSLFLADLYPMATGCKIVAIDLTNGTIQWTTQLKGVGAVSHSRYSNAVNMEATDNVVIVRGNEAAGRYVEILDIGTGKTVGYRVYKDNE